MPRLRRPNCEFLAELKTKNALPTIALRARNEKEILAQVNDALQLVAKKVLNVAGGMGYYSIVRVRATKSNPACIRIRLRLQQRHIKALHRQDERFDFLHPLSSYD